MRKFRFTLRTAIMLPLIMVFCLIIGSITLVQKLSYEKMVHDLSEKHLKILHQNINANLYNFINAPFKFSLSISNDIAYKLQYDDLDINEIKNYLRFAYQNIEDQLPHIDTIGFASESTGSFVGFRRESNRLFSLMESKKGGDDLIIYNSATNDSGIQKIISNFEPRNRYWYQPIYQKIQPVWSKIHVSKDAPPVLSMSSITPVLRGDTLIGTTGVNIQLTNFNAFLIKQLEQNNASVFIFDDYNYLIAQSSPKNLLIIENGPKDPPNEKLSSPSEENKITHSSDPIIKSAALKIETLPFKQRSDDIFSFQYNDERYFGLVAPYNDESGISWNIAIALPEYTLVGNLPEQQNQTLYTLFFCCAIVAMIGFAVFNSITSKIKATATAASALAKGNWETLAPSTSSIVEIQSLGESFNNMSSELNEAFNTLQYKLRYDSLTLLLNRKGLIDAYNQLEHKQGIVIVFGIERLNEMNDSLGLDKANQGLINVAQKIQSISPKNALVARISDCEFAVYIPNILTVHCTPEFIYRLQAQFHSPIQIEDEFVIINHVISSAFTTIDHSMSNTLGNALIALSNAKKDPSLYVAYQPEMAEASQHRSHMISEMTKAIKNAEFVPYYQPLVLLKNNHVIGAEALVRWVSPEHGIIMPDEFIPLAEEYGLINKIGYQILHRACLDTKIEIDAGRWPKNFHIHVNVSVKQLLFAQFAGELKTILNHTHLPSRNLTLEITESNIINNSPVMKENLAAIKKLGVKLAIDDFGTGYSSLAYLQDMDFDSLKIDRSFISRLDKATADTSIVSSILTMMHNFNIPVVSEGIETEEQAQILTILGCQVSQGYLYSRPVALKDWPYDLGK